MNLTYLYYFKKVAETLHYTQAAKELFVTQPTLSGAISSIEDELGVKLFQRQGRGIELTRYGKEFLIYVDQSLQVLEKGISIMKSYSGLSDEVGEIKIGCIYTVETRELPLLMQRFQQEYPNRVQFNLSRAISQDLLDRLDMGQFDAIFAAKNERTEKSLVYIPVFYQELVVALPKNHPFASKKFLLPRDLKKVNVVTYREQIPLGKAVARFSDSLNLEKIDFAYDDEAILAGVVAAGRNVALILNTFFLQHIDDIIIKPLYNNAKEMKSFYHTVYMIYRKDQFHPFCVDNFIEFVALNSEEFINQSMILID